MNVLQRAASLLSLTRGLRFYNTLTKQIEPFAPMPGAREIRMYNCGPTVYGEQHIGNLSMFVFTDVLRRALEYNGFEVKQVINFTDVGHLAGDNQGDADLGEDRMTKGLIREGLPLTLENMRVLGEKYASIFKRDLQRLNIDTQRILFPFASDYIAADIAMVQTLEEKGYAYRGHDGVYFDTSRFAKYGELGGINLEGLKEGARVERSSDKRHPTDFLLWKADPAIGWDSPWGKGFPGWHIECSAMIRTILGRQIDIHTGGIEHIPIHHNNEIAQSECATGRSPLARFWMHRAHIQIDGGKISKSEGNVVYLSDIIEKGFHPLSLRYLFLTAQYRTASNFSWDALQAAQTAFLKLVALRQSLMLDVGTVSQSWHTKFAQAINDDLDTPKALAVLWNLTKDTSISREQLLGTLLDFDQVLGLNLALPDHLAIRLAIAHGRDAVSIEDLDDEVRILVTEREEARTERNFKRADELRAEIGHRGYGIEDLPEGPRLFRK